MGKGEEDAMIAIVDYGGGNLTSVARAVSFLSHGCRITGDPEEILSADRVIFPGVGAAGAAMETMTARGIDTALKEVLDAGTPMLGICVGCQIILDSSEENSTRCLGMIPGRARAFSEDMPDAYGTGVLKVPHMGWNGLTVVKSHPLLKGIKERDEFYFVHSYYPEPDNSDAVYGVTEYGISFAAAVGKENLFATQFHLEKSGEPGLLILNNFCEWSPC